MVRVFTFLAALLAAAGLATAAAPKKITPDRVGDVRIGMTYREAREAGLIGKLKDGCPLASPPRKYAELRRPLVGGVEFRRGSPRRVQIISVRGGAKARGVGIGATIKQIKAAFPKAKVDHGTDDTFGITLVTVPKDGGGKLQFAVSTRTDRTTEIGVPVIPFCE